MSRREGDSNDNHGLNERPTRSRAERRREGKFEVAASRSATHAVKEKQPDEPAMLDRDTGDGEKVNANKDLELNPHVQPVEDTDSTINLAKNKCTVHSLDTVSGGTTVKARMLTVSDGLGTPCV